MHYAMMIVPGVGFFPAVRLVEEKPDTLAISPSLAKRCRDFRLPHSVLIDSFSLASFYPLRKCRESPSKY
jgi:hypothetical protein